MKAEIIDMMKTIDVCVDTINDSKLSKSWHESQYNSTELAIVKFFCEILSKYNLSCNRAMKLKSIRENNEYLEDFVYYDDSHSLLHNCSPNRKSFTNVLVQFMDTCCYMNMNASGGAKHCSTDWHEEWGKCENIVEQFVYFSQLCQKCGVHGLGMDGWIDHTNGQYEDTGCCEDCLESEEY